MLNILSTSYKLSLTVAKSWQAVFWPEANTSWPELDTKSAPAGEGGGGRGEGRRRGGEWRGGEGRGGEWRGGEGRGGEGIGKVRVSEVK